MEKARLNFAGLLGENPRIDPDILFKVVERTFVDGREETSSEVVPAHKFLLAMFSDVFQAQFYGPMANAEVEVLVEETTVAAFKEFLRIIYALRFSNNAEGRCDNYTCDAELVFEILTLAKRYLVDLAVELLEDTIAYKMKLNDANVIPIGILADKYTKFLGFEIVSEKLLKNCSDFLNAPLRSLNKMRKFLSKVEKEFSGENLKLILRLIANEDNGRDRSRSRSRDVSRSRSRSPMFRRSPSSSSSVHSGYASSGYIDMMRQSPLSPVEPSSWAKSPSYSYHGSRSSSNDSRR